MKLIDLKMNEYLDILFSDAPAPGGGSVSALAGAQAAAMMGMVANLTIGKKKYAEWEEENIAARARAEDLYRRFAEAIDNDTAAYSLVAAAYKMPKETDEEKAARSKAIADATVGATEVPFDMMKIADEGFDVVQELLGKSNPNAVSDLGVAVLNLMSCMKGAWLNVKINLPGLKDEEMAARFASEGKALIEKNEALARRLYNVIEESL